MATVYKGHSVGMSTANSLRNYNTSLNDPNAYPIEVGIWYNPVTSEFTNHAGYAFQSDRQEMLAEKYHIKKSLWNYHAPYTAKEIVLQIDSMLDLIKRQKYG